MSDNGKLDTLMASVTRSEFEQGMEEQVANIIDVMNVVNALKEAVNKQAIALSLNRYILEKFVPAPMLAQAVKEYSDRVNQEIAKDAAASQTVN